MIIVAALTAGAASAALGSTAGATAGSGTAMAAAGTSAAGAATAAGWGNVALTAVATSAAGTATVSTINNKGNLGAVIQDVTSRDALKGYAIAGVTAGMTAGYFDDWTGTSTDPLTGKITTNLSTWKGIGQFAANQGLQNGTSVAMSRIMGQGGDLGDVLQNTLFNTLAAASFHTVGDYVPAADGSLQKIMVHAMVGGLLAQVGSGDFKTGALAAGANEAVVADLNKLVQGNPNLLSMSSQLVGLLAASTQSGADEHSLSTGAWVAQNGTQYNFGDHMPPGLTEYGQAATTLVEYMQNQGAPAEEVDQVARALAQGQGFEGVQPANEFVKAWGEFMAGELSGLGLAAVLGKAGSWFAKGTLNTSLLDELTANGVKFTPENVVATTRSSNGKVVFLETGNSKAGLQHIIEEHGSQFAQMGVSEAQIPSVVMKAVFEGKLVGYQGSGAGRPIYELTINGQQQRIAVTVGDNGFVVGANPRGSIK
jgi:filamentous hemagglutinin